MSQILRLQKNCQSTLCHMRTCTPECLSPNPQVSYHNLLRFCKSGPGFLPKLLIYQFPSARSALATLAPCSGSYMPHLRCLMVCVFSVPSVGDTRPLDRYMVQSLHAGFCPNETSTEWSPLATFSHIPLLSSLLFNS